MTYSIKIYDGSNNIIGELATATPDIILQYINKGFIVKDITTDQIITAADITANMGVSDGFINIG